MPLRRRRLLISAAACLPALWPLGHSHAAAFDHTHTVFTDLLKRHVVLLRGGQASQVRYVDLARDRRTLKSYLSSLSDVNATEFNAFSLAQRQAFLINSYNGFTLELILTKYPELNSIKDLGSFLTSPWKPKWIQLLGGQVSLDDIEHGMLRKRGVYDDPRVHFAVNCASIGCPMLREEAFVATRIDAQLDEQTVRFMSDRSRNRFDESSGRLQLSRIFDWYGDDFKRGDRGIDSLEAFASQHADLLSDSPSGRDRIRGGQFKLSFLDYDWTLNDVRQ
ncbi:MAG: DUF547 domain-containing protein [Betaproteobacteria bacterium HGW-Betaproteobacteria-16]|nr:MAG: DUF547 domain-containing protein [Betaproteobacteria bacterium HGW-Betaproteobacteria-16]